MKKIFAIFIITLIIVNLYCGAVSASNDPYTQNISGYVETSQSFNSSNETKHKSAEISDQGIKSLTDTNAYNSFSNVYGYWVNPRATGIDSLDPNTLWKKGITDLFVLTSKDDPDGTLLPFIKKFSGSGIRIHAWVICFSRNGTFFAPDENPGPVNDLVNKITSIATKYNVDGIHLDYVRYSGEAYKHENATQNVTSFVQRIYNNIADINSKNIPAKPKILLSAALKPECPNGIPADRTLANISYYYGQDYGQLSNYLDFLVPMVYKGTFNENTDWIGTTTSYIVSQAHGKPVVTGLQSYVSDYDTTRFPGDELLTDVEVAMGNGSSGYIMFRYGLISPQFPGTPIKASFTPEQISIAAGNTRNYIEVNNVLPNYLLIDGVQVNMPQFLSLLVNAVLEAKLGDDTPIKLNYFSLPSSPSETLKSGSLSKADYLSIAGKVKSFMDTKGLVPNYAGSKLGNIKYQSLIYFYSKIMTSYEADGNLPDYASISSWPPNFIAPRVVSTDPANNTVGVPLNSIITINFSKNIVPGTAYSGIYIKNLASGAKVSISSKTISGNTLTIKQTNNRKSNTWYMLYIPAGAVKDVYGNKIVSAYTSKFKTV